MNMQDAISAVLTSWQSGQFPQHIARSLISLHGPSREWSYTNRILMMLHEASDARGYRQWEVVGRHVKKGAKAIPILAPRLIKKRTASGEKTSESSQDEPKQVLVGFRVVPVFDILATEGNPLPEYAPTTPPPLFDVARAWGLSVEWLPGNGRSFGYYAPEQEQIALHTHSATTWFHELTHAAEYRLRGGLVAGQDPEQEIVAQASAAILAELYGIPSDGAYLRAYVAAYGQCQPADASVVVMRLMRRIEAAIVAILTAAGQQHLVLPVDERE